jgi:hypothetical protein
LLPVSLNARDGRMSPITTMILAGVTERFRLLPSACCTVRCDLECCPHRDSRWITCASGRTRSEDGSAVRAFRGCRAVVEAASGDASTTPLVDTPGLRRIWSLLHQRQSRCGSTIRYDPPGRRSNRPNLPVMPAGGSDAARASGSTRAGIDLLKRDGDHP